MSVAFRVAIGASRPSHESRPTYHGGVTLSRCKDFHEGFACLSPNITGVSSINSELDAKRLALLKEVRPRLTRVGVRRSPIDPSGAAQVKATETAARSLGMELQVLGVISTGMIMSASAALRAPRSSRTFR